MRVDEERTFHEAVGALCVPNRVTIGGITGQAGAGKTNRVSPLVMQIADEHGFTAALLPLDAFFRYSTAQRTAWLQEGERIGPEEAARRRDQMSWWDFDKALATLAALKRGEEVHLTKVYNRKDHGELTGEVHIVPPSSGMLVVFEGVAICHMNGGVDTLMFVHAPPEVRFDRLLQRDPHRKGEKARERFALTEAFERPYFRKHWGSIHLHVDNSVDTPRMLHPMHPDAVFGPNGLEEPLAAAR